MATLLELLLPRFLPENIVYQVLPHEGKQDLEKSIPRKLRGWQDPDARFIVVRDNDNGDCKLLKAKLVKMCAENGHNDVLVRLVCQELEAWYLGDLAAVATAYNAPSIAKQQEKKSFRNPDQLVKPSDRIQKLVPTFTKIGGARAIAPHLRIETNRSRSFQVFVEGVGRLVRNSPDPSQQNCSKQTALSFPDIAS